MPILKSIRIEGLRGFGDVVRIPFAIPNGDSGSGLTLITGPNNSGKSTVIEAIKALGAAHQTPSFHAGMRNVKTGNVKIECEIDDKTNILRSLSPGSSQTVADRNAIFKPYIVPSRRHFQPEFGRSSVSSRDQYAEDSATHSGFREQSLSRFEGRLFLLESNKVAFDLLLRDLIPNFMDWSIDQNESGNYFVKLWSNSKSHSLSGSGDGIVSLFVIAAALFDSTSQSITAIDEPELSLHPTILRRLVTKIVKLSSDRQIIVSTHSPYLVDQHSLESGGKVLRCWDRGENLEIFELSRETCPALLKLLTPNVNNPHIFGLDAREMFFADDPILVFEGQEDVVFWPKLVMDRPELASISTFGWGAGGAANIKNVVSVLQSLGYKKVCGILDNNRPKDVTELKAMFPSYHFLELPAPDIRSKGAAKERPEVIGLLDNSGCVREHFKPGLNQMFVDLCDFLKS